MSTISIDCQKTLAIRGGIKVRSAPWPVRRLFGREEREAVQALFDAAIEKGHDVLGYNGPQEDGYCREFAQTLGGGYADGVNSGTSAVYVALRALELEPLSEVIVPAVTDPGGVMPVVLMQCVPVIADVAPGSYNIGVDQIKARITDRTRAILVAHIAGIPVDMDPILELASARGIPVVEDCAQAHGATYKGRSVGSFGTVSAFSTMFGKHHATGGQGGLVFTRDEARYWRVRRCADRGKPFGMTGTSGNVIPSLNLNMDELHASIGRVQLRKLSANVRRRREIAGAIASGCESLRHVRLVTDPPNGENSYWFLFVRLDVAGLSVSKTEFATAVAAEGVPADASYRHVASEAPWWKAARLSGGRDEPIPLPASTPLPNLDETEACHIRIPFHEDWTQQEVDDLLRALRKVEDAFSK